jgi:hypothetical protein
MPRNAATNRFLVRNIPASLFFDGTGDFVTLGNLSVLNVTSALTISARVYLSNVSATSTIFGKSDGGITQGYRLRVTAGGKVTFFVASGGAQKRVDSDVVLQTNTWYHIVATADTTDARVYVNASLQTGDIQPTGSALTTSTASARIGDDVGSTASFNGNLSEVCFWNTALTQNQVTDLCFSGAIPSTGLVGKWLLDEGAGSTALDTSSSANNGTITGAVYSANTPFKSRKRSINGNKVRNGDFEYAPPFTAVTSSSPRWIDGTSGGSTTNDLFGWYYIVGVGNFDATFDTTTKFSGSASMRIEATNTTGRGRVMTAPFEGSTTPSLIKQYGFQLSPNTTYTISFKGKTNNVGGNSNVLVRVASFDSAGTLIGTLGNQNLTDNTDWTDYTTSFTTATTTAYGIIYFLWSAAGTVGQAWADNIVLTPVYPEGRVPANGNLVKNFDFEVAPTFVAATSTAGRWIDGTASGSANNATYKWATAAAALTATVGASFDTTVSYRGSASLKLEALDATGVIVVANIQVASVGGSLGTIPITPSTAYTFSAWVKTSTVGTNGAYMDVRQFNAGAGVITTTSSTKLSGTNDWTQVTGSFTSDAAATNVCILFRNTIAGQASIMWVDEVYLAKTTNPGRVLIT